MQSLTHTVCELSHSTIVSCLQAPGGVQSIYRELSVNDDQPSSSNQNSNRPSAKGVAAALAFLASCVKDQGAVGPAIQLLQKVRTTCAL